MGIALHGLDTQLIDKLSDNVVVNIDGNIDLPKQISVIQQKINATTNPASTYAVPWIYISGKLSFLHTIPCGEIRLINKAVVLTFSNTR